MTSPQTARSAIWESKAAFYNSWKAVFADARFSLGSSDMFSFDTIHWRERETERERERERKKDLILLRCAWTSCVFKWLAIVCRFLNSQGLDSETERERAQEEDEGRKERRSRARGERVRARCCGGVLSKALTPPSTPTYPPARPPPAIPHT